MILYIDRDFVLLLTQLVFGALRVAAKVEGCDTSRVEDGSKRMNWILELSSIIHIVLNKNYMDWMPLRLVDDSSQVLVFDKGDGDAARVSDIQLLWQEQFSSWTWRPESVPSAHVPAR